MTSRTREDVLQYFKGGLHKILVATSVAEEGLDVQKCNYVIRYLHVTTDIARIQSRGRARADNAQYVVVGDRERGTIIKDEGNKALERMTNNALKLLDTLDPAAKRHKVADLQWKAKSERDVENKQKEFQAAARQSRTHEGEYQLRCLKCDNLSVWNTDIRTVNRQHYVVVDSTFEDRIVVEQHPSPLKYDDWVKKEKIYCSKCKQDWGVKADYKKVPCCVIKICSFVIVDPYEKRSYCKKWKDVQFPVEELSDQDMKELYEIALERLPAEISNSGI